MQEEINECRRCGLRYETKGCTPTYCKHFGEIRAKSDTSAIVKSMEHKIKAAEKLIRECLSVADNVECRPAGAASRNFLTVQDNLTRMLKPDNSGGYFAILLVDLKRLEQTL